MSGTRVYQPNLPARRQLLMGNLCVVSFFGFEFDFVKNYGNFLNSIFA